MSNRPLFIVVSAPSGAGKTTLCDRILDKYENITYSVSCTTRLPRGQEIDGKDYHFLKEDDFKHKINHDEFLEHAIVHGNMYGTLKQTIQSAMNADKSVMMDIDIQGAAQIRKVLSDLPISDPMRSGFIDIFISPPSMVELRKRLEDRAEDTQDVIKERLKNAKVEMAGADDYLYIIVNDNLDQAYAELCDILKAEWEQ